ncbi:hypothetical protein F5Y04DRAFT_51595 [Hypomontagnella monticulosa]|nr:hypothetical protein F5Y04DRAFT_51595 [Hypomontagnella monticulosa]
MEDSKPTLHYMQHSGSHQSLWLLEELGIEYNLVLHGRENGRAAAALRDTHPLGKAPQLVTSSGRAIAERSAIAFYLIETYDTAGRFKVPPIGTDPNHDGVKYDKFREKELFSVAMTSLNQFLSLKSTMGALAVLTPFFIRPLVWGFKYALEKAFLDAEIDNCFKFLDGELEEGKYLNGTLQPTRLDFVMQFYVDFAAEGCLLDLDKYPKVKAWYERCKSRDAWKRALEKGNGYDMGFWRKL